MSVDSPKQEFKIKGQADASKKKGKWDEDDTVSLQGRHGDKCLR